MKQWKVGIIGATGMVGQRFATLLDGHPWFQVVALAASPRSAGKTYEAAVGSRWAMTTPMPETMKDMVMLDAQADIEKIAGMVDFVFCAVDMKKDEIRALEEAYAKAECPVVSNNSAHRFTPDVPMVIPEVNPEHLDIIASQRKRLGTKKGFMHWLGTGNHWMIVSTIVYILISLLFLWIAAKRITPISHRKAKELVDGRNNVPETKN